MNSGAVLLTSCRRLHLKEETCGWRAHRAMAEDFVCWVLRWLPNKNAQVREKGTKWGSWVDLCRESWWHGLVFWTYIGMDAPRCAPSKYWLVFFLAPIWSRRTWTIYPNKTDPTPAFTTVILSVPLNSSMYFKVNLPYNNRQKESNMLFQLLISNTQKKYQKLKMHFGKSPQQPQVPTLHPHGQTQGCRGSTLPCTAAVDRGTAPAEVTTQGTLEAERKLLKHWVIC